MPEPLLRVRDLRVDYPAPGKTPRPAVDGVSFDLAAGEALGVLGESGGGKSSLALAIPGLLPPPGRIAGGTIALGDRALEHLDERRFEKIRGAEIGLIFQEPALALHPLLRAGTQLEEVLRAHRGGSRSSRRQAALELLADAGFDAPEEIYDAYPHELSGGQRQRVAIAQALAGRPALLVADEPTAALDAPIEARVLALLRRLKKRGLALLVISHDPRVLDAIADKLLVLRAGRTVETGTRAEVFAAPRHPYTAALLRAVPPLPIASRPTRPPAPGHRAVTGRLRAARLAKTYRRRALTGAREIVAFADVDLELDAGAVVALVGASGSGKSSLARVLALIEAPTTGAIVFDGRPLTTRERRRPRVQLIFQDPGAAIPPRFSALETVAEPLAIRGWGDRDARRRRALELMREVGLDAGLARRPALATSGGQRQRLTLARALAAEPRLLILDEALSALDPPLRARIVDLLLELKRRRDLTYLLISHDLRLVAHLADRVLVMDRGRLVEDATPAALFARPRHPATRALVEAAAGTPPLAEHPP